MIDERGVALWYCMYLKVLRIAALVDVKQGDGGLVPRGQGFTYTSAMTFGDLGSCTYPKQLLCCQQHYPFEAECKLYLQIC